MRYKGIVQKGKKRGKKLGFPTINIEMHDTQESGIFAAYVTIDDRKYPAAVYADSPRRIIEAHLLDFSKNVYGEEVEIELLKKVRDDETFDDEKSLKAAIAADVARVREYFAN